MKSVAESSDSTLNALLQMFGSSRRALFHQIILASDLSRTYSSSESEGDRPRAESKLPTRETWRSTTASFAYFWGKYSQAIDKTPLGRSSVAPSLLPIDHLISYIRTTTMLASSSRTALRQAATKQLSVKSSVRAVSVWSQIPQGPPVSAHSHCNTNRARRRLTTR